MNMRGQPIFDANEQSPRLLPAQGGWYRNFYVRARFFYAWGCAILLVALGYLWMPLLFLGAVVGIVILLLAMWDLVSVSAAGRQLFARRKVDRHLSLGDDNTVSMLVEYRGTQRIDFTLLEELPDQFQERDFGIEFSIASGELRQLDYRIKPLSRGIYTFGRSYIFARTRLALVERRFAFGPDQESVAVYPSVLQMRQQALRVRQLMRREGASQRQRQLGRSYEFDQLKNYVPGDDYRQLNWKATARANALMANTFVEERSQQVIALLDASRTMLLPFDGLSLLDYAINSTLALLNVALMRGDRVGMLAFDRNIHSQLQPSSRPEQLQRALQLLYAQVPTDFEPDFDALSQTVVRKVKGRSLLLLYTNFDTMVSLERNLPALKRMARSHVLVVVTFVNTEVAELQHARAATLEQAYLATIAAEYEATQSQIANTLLQSGILVLRTRPQELTAEAVTRYLDVKRRGQL